MFMAPTPAALLRFQDLKVVSNSLAVKLGSVMEQSSASSIQCNLLRLAEYFQQGKEIYSKFIPMNIMTFC